MSLYNVNWQKLVNNLLPGRLRTVNMMAWLNVLISPLVYIYNLFVNNRGANLYNLAHNGQVVYLQAALNDVFDKTARRILIADYTFIDPLYTYLAAENKPIALYTAAENRPIALYTNLETAASINGFIVQVPAAITYDAAYMRALIDKYRLPGKGGYIIMSV